MKVAVYLSGIPAKSKNQQKRQALLDFAQGVQASGDKVILVEDYKVVDCDIAVIQGWVNNKTGAHLKIRGDAIEHQRRHGQHIVAIDSNLLGFLEPSDFNRYLRYSLDGIFPTTGYYFDNQIDTGRWNSIKQNYGFTEKDWNRAGSRILICLQRNGGWSMGQTSVPEWLNQTISKLRQYTDRRIIVRPHPGNQDIVSQLKITDTRTTITTMSDIRDDLLQSWATITYNSSPGVASLLWGVPVWVTDPEPAKSQVATWAETDLACIETPKHPDRTDLYHRLAQCHFNSAELVSGTAWQFMRQRLPNTPRQ